MILFKKVTASGKKVFLICGRKEKNWICKAVGEEREYAENVLQTQRHFGRKSLVPVCILYILNNACMY